MSNRAIRREQLNFDPLYADKQGCISQPLNDIMIADMSVWEFLQEANNLSIEVGGKQAYHYRQELTNKISGNHHYQNL